MITFYHAPQTRSSRIIWLLEELGQSYTIVPVSIAHVGSTTKGDPRNPHPDKQVPAIEHDDVLIIESIAITAYLTDAFPAAGLAPLVGDPLRGPYLAWLAWYAAALEPAAIAARMGELDNNPIKRRDYERAVSRLEDRLWTMPYLLGDTFSAADLIVVSVLAWSRAFFPESAVIDAYIARCHERPAAQRAMALDDAEGVQHGAEELALAS